MKRQDLIDAISVVRNLASSETFSYPWILLTTEFGKLCAFADRGYCKIGTTVDCDPQEKFSYKLNVTQLGEILGTLKGDEIEMTADGVSLHFKCGRQHVSTITLGLDNTVEKALAFFSESEFGNPALSLPKDIAKEVLSFGSSFKSFDLPDGTGHLGGVWFRNNYAYVVRHGHPKDALFLTGVGSAIDFPLFGRVGAVISPKSDIDFFVGNGVSVIFGNTRVHYSVPEPYANYKTDALFWGANVVKEVGTVTVPVMSSFNKFGASNLIWNAKDKTITPNEYKDCIYTEEFAGTLSEDIITPVLPIPSCDYTVYDCGHSYKFCGEKITYLVGKIRL